ncbi:MAG: InlB B-repeat-containing protein [Clostridia bacterium]|nr:InlB B-repeat-containing protein [Clostridia bacterium]
MKLAKQTLAVLLAFVMAFSAFSIVGFAANNAVTSIDVSADSGAQGKMTFGLNVLKDGAALSDGDTLSPGDVVDVQLKIGTDFYLGFLSTEILYDSDYFEPYLDGAAYTTDPGNTFAPSDGKYFIQKITDNAPVAQSVNGSYYSLFDTLMPDASGGLNCLVNKASNVSIVKKNIPLYMREVVNGSQKQANNVAAEYASLHFVKFELTPGTTSDALGYLIKVPYAPYFSFQLRVKEGVSTDGDAKAAIFVPIGGAKRASRNENCNVLLASECDTGFITSTGIPQWGQAIDCADADYSFVVGSAAPQVHTHDYVLTSTVPATCTTAGSKTYTCQSTVGTCDEPTYTETIPALGHNYQVTESQAATCTEAGYMIETCQNAGCPEPTKRTDYPATGHSWKVSTALSKAPSCTEDGYTFYVCENNSAHTRQEPIEKLGHSWTEWTQTVAPTTTSKGEEERSCTRCGETETRDVDPLPITEADYVVEVYTMDTTGNYVKTTEPAVTADIGSTVSVNGADYEQTGLTFNAEKSTTSTTLTADGATLSVYLDRAKVTYSFKVYDYTLDDGTYTQYEDAEYYYGAEVVLPIDPTVDGYTFTGWTVNGASFTGGTAGLTDVEVYAQFDKNIDPGSEATPEQLAEQAALIAKLVNPVNLKFYTDEAILAVAAALGVRNAEVDTFLADVIANGYSYKGVATTGDVQASIDALAVLTATGSAATDGALAKVKTVDSLDMGINRDESKANLKVSVVPVELNGEPISLKEGKAFAPKAGDRITFALKVETDYYVSAFDIPVVYDSTKFRLVNTEGETFDFDDHDDEDMDNGHWNILDLDPSTGCTPTLASTINRNYTVELFTAESSEGQYPEEYQGTYAETNKILLFELLCKTARTTKAQIFTEDVSQMCTFVLEAKEGFEYDGSIESAVGAKADWYAGAGNTRDNLFKVTRAAGYNGDGSLANVGSSAKYSFEIFDKYSQFGQTCTTEDAEVVFGSAACEHQWGDWYKLDDAQHERECELCHEKEQADHSFVTYVSNNDATCTEDGTKTATCEFCDATNTIADVGSAKGHSYTNYVSNNDATCTADGTKTATCDNGCGTTDTIADVGSAKGHSYTNYVSNNDATCTEDGTKTATCDNGCGTTDTIADVGSAKGHSYTNYVSNNDATCTEDGTKTATCDNGCGTTDTIADVGSAKGHDFGAWFVVTAATTEADGLERRECSRCDAYEERVIPKIVVTDGAVLWAGYEDDYDTIKASITGDNAPAAFADNTVYVVAKKGANNLPSKIQIRSTAGTMTYTRAHGAVTIVDVTFAGEDCELWIFDRELPDDNYVAVAKYANVPFTAIPDSDGAAFSVETPVAPVSADVYSAEIAVIDETLGYVVFDGITQQTITIKTGLDVTKVQLQTNDASKYTMTYNSNNATVTEGEFNGTPCKVWTITRLFGKNDYDYSINVRTAKDGLKDSGVDLAFKVADAPIAKLVSVDVAYAEGNAVFTVVTADNASKVKFTNTVDNGTITIKEGHAWASTKDNGDGSKTWTITIAHAAGVEFNYDVQACVGSYSDPINVTVKVPAAEA